MCPACINSYIATATVIGGISSSAGGIVAIVLKKLKKFKPKENGDAAAKGRV